MRERGSQFIDGFEEIFRTARPQDPQTPIRTPVANALAERLGRDAAARTPNRTIIWNQQQLERLVDYIDHYGCKSSGSSDGGALGDELAICPLGVDGHLLFSETLLG